MSGVVIVGADPARGRDYPYARPQRHRGGAVERGGGFARAFRGDGMMPAGFAAPHAMGLGEGASTAAFTG